MLSPFVSQKLCMLASKEKGEDLFVLKDLIEHGKVTPVIDATYALSEARGHSSSGRGTRPRKSRHHRVRRLPAGRQLKGHCRTLGMAWPELSPEATLDRLNVRRVCTDNSARIVRP
jgi:hypothetical protein